jgi:CubicO group peptidase (beta-lactamase class C family)
MTAPDDQTAAERTRRVESGILTEPLLKTQPRVRESLAQRMHACCTPGVSIAVVNQGKIEWVRGYGVRESGQPDPITPETRFQAASISKPVAALVALRLVEEGRLGLDEDLKRYLSGWRLPANAGWQPRITLRQLLTHSAGLTVGGFLGYTRPAELPTLPQVLDGEPPANSPAIRVDTLPSLQFRYSGGGFCILQQLVEDLTGQPFYQSARERVLEPVGMFHSTYEVPLPTAWQRLAASGHRTDGEPLDGKWHLYPESAAAGLWTTPSDLARLVVALQQTLAGQASPVLSAGMLEQMLTPQVEVRELSRPGWMGLGFFLWKAGERWYFSHGGSNEGYRCRLTASKTGGQAVVVMTNSDGALPLLDEVVNTIAQEYGWPDYLPAAWVPAALDRDLAAQACGNYRTPAGLRLAVISGEAGLQLQADGQDPLPLVPRSEQDFFCNGINLEVSFILQGGRCPGLVLRQNGEELAGERTAD